MPVLDDAAGREAPMLEVSQVILSPRRLASVSHAGQLKCDKCRASRAADKVCVPGRSSGSTALSKCAPCRTSKQSCNWGREIPACLNHLKWAIHKAQLRDDSEESVEGRGVDDSEDDEEPPRSQSIGGSEDGEEPPGRQGVDHPEGRGNDGDFENKTFLRLFEGVTLIARGAALERRRAAEVEQVEEMKEVFFGIREGTRFANDRPGALN
jgi:hypothetical protein